MFYKSAQPVLGKNLFTNIFIFSLLLFVYWSCSIQQSIGRWGSSGVFPATLLLHFNICQRPQLYSLVIFKVTSSKKRRQLFLLFFLHCLLKPVFQGLIALLIVCLAYYTILTPRPLYTYKQLYCLQQLLILSIFIRLNFQAVFIQAVIYSSLYILYYCLRGYCQSISNFLRVFFLIKFFNSVSLVNLQYWDSDIKGYPYRYIICG